MGQPFLTCNLPYASSQENISLGSSPIVIRVIFFFGLRGEKEGGICSNFWFYFFSPSGAGIPLAFPTPKNGLDRLSPTAFPVKTIKRFSGPKKGGVSNRGLIQLRFLEMPMSRYARLYALCALSLSKAPNELQSACHESKITWPFAGGSF